MSGRPPAVSVHSIERDASELSGLVHAHLPELSPRSIVIKPNWVRHAVSPHFPIEALVTDTRLIDATVEACLRRYASAETITVGDVPLQDCDWERLAAQAGLDALARKYDGNSGPRVTVCDLRRERFRLVDGFLERCPPGDYGDPLGYREVRLGRDSFLEAISGERSRFRVSDYEGTLTSDSHKPGEHRYLVAASVLDADLVINMPKMKTHQKAGITGALKNLVGVNGQKAYLVHYRKGSPRRGGDEFAPDAPLPVRLQVRVREALQKRSPFLFKTLRAPWRVLRRTRGIQTEGTRGNLEKTFYMAGGAWYGNDTIWRMIYDLNRIVRFASKDGTEIRDVPQRRYLAILDGMVAGEGNGPLQPLPVPCGLLAFARDPFCLDHVMARLMGFDAARIPQLAHHRAFGGGEWGAFDPGDIVVEKDGVTQAAASLGAPRPFVAAPGWRGHIELRGRT